MSSPSTAVKRALFGAALLVSLSAGAYVLPQGAILRRLAYYDSSTALAVRSSRIARMRTRSGCPSART